MTKKSLSLLMIISIFLLTALNSSNANAESIDYASQYIKVGLEKNLSSRSSVSLNGSGFSVVRENGSVDKLFDINNKTIIIKPKSFSYHIELSETFTNYNSALKKSNEIKDAYVTYNNGFKVYIGEFSNEISAKQSLGKLSSNSQALVAKNEALVSVEGTKGEKIISFDKLQKIYVKSLSETTNVEKKNYRGFVGFSVNNNKLTTINLVELDDYLKGVVPREMSGSWNIEALKAQAVSARNYTLRSLNKHKAAGFDICDSTHCQVYDGFDVEHVNSNKAIEETKNKLLKYNGEIAQTFYYSSSGGYTVSNEDAWNGVAIPYLRGKEDPFSVGTPNGNWSYTITKAEASKKLKDNGLDVGNIISFEAKKDALGARIIELKVIGTKGEKVILKEKIRTIFGTSNIKSTNYTIVGAEEIQSPVKNPTETVVSPEAYVLSSHSSGKTSLDNKNVVTADGVEKLNGNSEEIVISDGDKSVVKETVKTPIQVPTTSTINLSGNTIMFQGTGWGHGVGMSQYGALNMAKLGHSYKDILEFYYTGAIVE